MISSPSSFPSPPITITTNEQQSPLNTIRTWFKSLPFNRFIQSFTKHSHQNQNNISKSRKTSRHGSIASTGLSDIVY